MSKILLGAGVFVFAGCGTPLYLMNIGTVAPKQPGLAGRTVYVAAFADTNNVEADWTQTQFVDLKYEYVELTGAQEDAWEAELDKRANSVPEDKQYLLGWARNIYGMRVHDYKSVNTPGEWLKQAITEELAAQGATVVDTQEGADVVLESTLAYLRVDAYMAILCDLVVDVVIKANGQTASKRFHARGADSAMQGQETGAFAVLRQAQQQLVLMLFPEIEAVLTGKAAPSTGAPTPPQT